MDLPTVGPAVSSQNWKAVFPLKEDVLPHRKYRQLMHRQYIKNASLNMSFSQDVVNSMAFYRVPFKDKDGSSMFNLFEVVTPREVKPYPPSKPGRLNRMPQRCSSRCRKPKQEAEGQKGTLTTGNSDWILSPGRRPKSLLPAQTLTDAVPPPEGSSTVAQTLLTQAAEQRSEQGGGPPKRAEEDSPGLQRQREHWDEYLVKKLSKRTAQWLVTKQMPKGPSRIRLSGLLQDRYGSAHAHVLVQDETMTTSDFSLYDQIKAQESRVAVVRKVTKTPLTAYYRVPGFELSEDFTEEPGVVNRTAANLIVKHFEPPPKPKTVLNSKLGKHVYYTENVFEQELYTGSSSMVHHHGEKYKERIIMDNLSEYQKHLQDRFPTLPVEWSEDKGDEGKRQTPAGPKRVSKGLRRWAALPTLADYTMEQGLRLPDYELVGKPVNKSFKRREDLQVVRNMVAEWIKAWRIYSHWQDITIEELKRDLKAIHSHVQLNALATCASGAIERPKLEEDEDLIKIHLRGEVQAVPEALQPLISEALNNSNKHVRLAAAICHVAMEKVNERVTEILQDNLLHGNVADRWIAAQSLALNGDDSYPVVNRIIQHLFETPEPETIKQVCLILGPLSERTTLAHFILAKHLNSRNWKDKVLACQVLSCLQGSLNKDLTHKIVHLMWNDWNSNVRQAATHSLGALGLGKEAHDELRERLDKGDSRTRIEALSCIGQLGVMTGKLMPSFLECFRDDFIGVRREACLTAGLLRIKDEQVLEHLVHLMQSDHIWKVKAYAIKALGAIGHVTEQLKNLLLWALHYEPEPGIRMEACNSIVSLNLRDADVQNVLRELILVEPHPLVREDVRLALQTLGGSSEVYEGLLPKIRQQIQTLCQKDVVIWKLLRVEMVKLTVAEQVERINLLKQPEHLKVLRERIEHLNKNVTAPSLPSMQVNFEDFKECEDEIQAVLDSSAPAGSQMAEQRESARCLRDGEWQIVNGDDLQYSRVLREVTQASQLQETESMENSPLELQMESEV
ncbi:HEAT repeat-containing protein 4 [Heterodontus francisci]|uniref:HEAT repeat-containing protein 4 n=1 Tax=Heterodontus francisci TaxID=7792 RepID=UPI00355BA56A